MRHLSKNLVIALALLAAGFLVAWLRFRPHLGTEGHYTDGAEAFEIEDAGRVRYAVWGAPEDWAGEALEEELGATVEGRVTRSPDGRFVVFSVGELGLDMDLYVAEVVDGVPVDPRPALSLNSPADERAPSFGHGALYFASDRAGGAGGLDLYKASFDGGSFGVPERLHKSLQSTADETDPAPVPGAAALAFSSNRPHAGRRRDHDLYLGVPAAEGWQVQPMEALNSPAHEREPAFTADGRGLFFASDRSGGRGGYDLYRSAMALEGLVPPVPLIGINGAGSERAPVPDPAGFEMLLRVEQGGVQQLLRARSVELFRTPGRPVGWLDLLLLGLLLALALFAWLAKRWEQLDALYKCFLVSVVMHLLLAMWLHQVHPDPDSVPLAGHGDRLRIRLIGDPSGVRARNAERGGEVSYERVASVEAASLEPSFVCEPGKTRELQEVAPEAVSFEPASQLAPKAEAALASAETSDVEHERQTPDTAGLEPSWAVLQNTQDARAGDAPQLGLEAAVEFLRLEASFAGASGAAPAELPASQRSLAEAQPRSGEARRKVRLADAGQAALEAAELGDALPQESQRALSERGADLAQPMSVVQARQGGVPHMTVAGAARFDAAASSSGQTQLAPSRADEGTRRDAGQLAPGRASLHRDAAGTAEGASDLAAAQNAGMLEARPKAESLERPAGVRDLDFMAPERQGELSALALEAAGFEAGAQALLTTGMPTRSTLSNQAQLGAATPAAAGAERVVAGAAGSISPQGSAARTLAEASQHDSRGPKMASGGAQSFEPTRQAEVRPLELSVAKNAGLPSSDRERVEEAPARLDQENKARPLADAAWPVSAAATLTRPRSGSGAPAPAFSATKTSANLGEPKRPRGPDLLSLTNPTALVMPAAEPIPERSLANAPSAAASLDRPRSGASAGPRRLDRKASIGPLAGPILDLKPMPLTAAREPSLAAEAPAEQGGDWERTPYQSRAGQQKIEALETFGGSEETEQAVARGLAYLASQQREEGYWGSIRDKHEKYRHVLIGKTGLSLLAFLGAGHTHQSDTEYSAVVAGALRFLLAVQYDGSGHFGESSSYGHAIASYAVGECLALTGDDVLREPLGRAVAHILSKQMHSRDERLDGGWGYYFPDSEVFDRWPRASVTAWQVMALESAQLGGLDVPADAFDGARRFLRRCWDDRRVAFRYSHDPERLSGPYQILPGSTPASLFALSLLGDDISQPRFRQALNFVTERMPSGYRCRNTDRFVSRAEGNLYFWYYGTLSLFRLGGRRWEAWNEAMKMALLPAQLEDGSWEPVSIYATDYAGDDSRDRSYSTAMCVLSLEVYYRYFTPLLKVK